MAIFKQYELKNGTKAWQFQSYLGINPTTGKSIKTTRRGFKTKKEAQLELNRLLVDFEKGNHLNANISTFKEVYELWLVSYQNTVKETTSMATERNVIKHVLPMFGEYRVDKINVKSCQAAVNKWASKMTTYKAILRYASKIMDYAINLEMIDHNPFDKVIRPVLKKNELSKVKYYSLDELKTLFSFLDNKVQQAQNRTLRQQFFALFDLSFYRFLTYTGLRGGEAGALSWKDIDFVDKTVTVSKTMSETKHGFVVSTPKTKSSYRTISIDDKTLRILKRWQLKQREFLFTNGINRNEAVFCKYDGRRLNRADLYQRSSRLAEAAGLHNIGTHGYRHTHASLLFEAGVSMKEAQVRLGHSNIELTMNIYTHVTKKTTERTVEKLVLFANL